MSLPRTKPRARRSEASRTAQSEINTPNAKGQARPCCYSLLGTRYSVLEHLRQQPINIQLRLRAHINFPIGHRRRGELHRRTGRIPR